MSTPTEIIEMAVSSVHLLHPSFFGQPCFQIVTEGEDLELSVFQFAADSQEICKDWVDTLRCYMYCCETCAAINGYNGTTRRNEKLTSKAAGRFIQSLNLRIIEAKDLKSSLGPRVRVLPYCVVIFDDTPFARTICVPGESPVWDETFVFENLCPHLKSMRIAVFHRNRSGKDLDIGFVNVSLKSLASGSKVEKWLPVNALESATSGCSIRVAMTLTSEQILHTTAYDSFLELMIEPTFTSAKTLGHIVTSERDEFAKAFLNLMSAVNLERDAICSFINEDLSNIEDPNIIFRGTTLATKLIDFYMKQVGSEFMHSTLAPLITVVIQNNESCDTDPARVINSDVLQNNIARLLYFVKMFWNAIFDSIQKSFPKRISDIFVFTRECPSYRYVVNVHRI
eukprot:jgi/Hompol1/1407/HPOL_001475-RA